MHWHPLKTARRSKAIDAAVARETAVGALHGISRFLILDAARDPRSDVGAGDVRFRLLETTRAYALAKLEETGETETLAARYATYYRDFLESASNSSGEVLVAACAPEIDNIRAALTWAFGQGGDRSIAVALAAASAQVWLEMSLLTECHSWMGRALDLLSDADRGTRREMGLQNALGFSLMFTEGASSRVRAALARASELAKAFRTSTINCEPSRVSRSFAFVVKNFGTRSLSLAGPSRLPKALPIPSRFRRRKAS